MASTMVNNKVQTATRPTVGVRRFVVTLEPELEQQYPLAVPKAVAIDGPNVREVYATTWSAPGPRREQVAADPQSQVIDACEALEALLDRCELSPDDVVTLDVFARPDKALLAEADAALARLLPAGCPVQFLLAPPVARERTIAFQAYAVRAHHGRRLRRRYVEARDGSDGRGIVIEYGGFRHYYAVGIPGFKSTEGTLKQHCDKMFRRMDKWLHQEGFTLRDVMRTHLYYDGPYQDLRQGRHDYFDRHRLTDVEFPASTGIWGQPRIGKVMLKFHAVQATGKRPLVTHRVDPRTQSQAFDYGSWFVRARWVETDVAKLEVSGTASMSRDGRAVYEGRPKQQAFKTRCNVMDLVDRCGLTAQDLVRCLVYVCQPRHLKPWEQSFKADHNGEVPTAIVTTVQANICWFPLTVEEEATAVSPRLPGETS